MVSPPKIAQPQATQLELRIRIAKVLASFDDPETTWKEYSPDERTPYLRRAIAIVVDLLSEFPQLIEGEGRTERRPPVYQNSTISVARSTLTISPPLTWTEIKKYNSLRKRNEVLSLQLKESEEETDEGILLRTTAHTIKVNTNGNYSQLKKFFFQLIHLFPGRLIGYITFVHEGSPTRKRVGVDEEGQVREEQSQSFPVSLWPDGSPVEDCGENDD
jgi:hypothetical protein